MWRCEACQQSFDTCQRRYTLSLKAADSSGSCWLNAFNEQAAQIFGMSADDLHALRENNDGSFERTVQKALWSTYVMKLKARALSPPGSARACFAPAPLHQAAAEGPPVFPRLGTPFCLQSKTELYKQEANRRITAVSLQKCARPPIEPPPPQLQRFATRTRWMPPAPPDARTAAALSPQAGFRRRVQGAPAAYQGLRLSGRRAVGAARGARATEPDGEDSGRQDAAQLFWMAWERIIQPKMFVVSLLLASSVCVSTGDVVVVGDEPERHHHMLHPKNPGPATIHVPLPRVVGMVGGS